MRLQDKKEEKTSAETCSEEKQVTEVVKEKVSNCKTLYAAGVVKNE